MVRHFRISSDWIKPSFSPLTNNKPRCTDWRANSTKLLLLRFANMSNTCMYFGAFSCFSNVSTYRITCMIVGGVCEQVWLCILEWAVWSLGHLVVRRRRRRDKLVESTKSQGVPSNCHQFKLPSQNWQMLRTSFYISNGFRIYDFTISVCSNAFRYIMLTHTNLLVYSLL